MYKQLVALLLIALCSLSVLAQTPSRGLFWEISSAESTIYLLGSIHLAKPSLYPLDRAIEEAFDRSDVLVVEVTQEAMASKHFQQQLAARGYYPGNESLADNLDADTYALLQAFLQKHQLPLEPFLKMKPGLVAMSLAGFQMRALGFSSEYGIERYFERRARGQKRINSLETVEEQLKLIIEMPSANALLKYSLLDMQQAEDMVDQLMKAWQQGDSQALEKLTLTPYVEEPEFQAVLDKIFFERNHRMAEKIESYLKKPETYFVVVGAGHLLGEQGIVELMRRRQFTARQY